MGWLPFCVIALTISILVSGSSVNGFKRLTRTEFKSLKETCGRWLTSNHPRGSVQRIAYGSSVKQGELPWAVSFVGLFLAPEMCTCDGKQCFAHSTSHCSGSIISKYHIMTAAHCVIWNNTCPGTFFLDIRKSFIAGGSPCADGNIHYLGQSISLSSNNRSCAGREHKEPLSIRIKRIIVPQSSLGSIPVNERLHQGEGVPDIAILELADPINMNEDLLPICVPDIYTKTPETYIAYGFGLTENQIDVELYKLTVDGNKSTSKKGCGIEWSNKRWCADTVTFNMDSDVGSICQGDSGGSLSGFVDGKEYLFGVISEGSEKHCNKTAERSNSTNVFTVTKVASYSDFLCFYTGICPLGYDVYSKRSYAESPEPVLSFTEENFMEYFDAGHFVVPERREEAEQKSSDESPDKNNCDYSDEDCYYD